MKFEVKSRHVTRVWDLNSKLRAILAPIAAEFGWTVEVLLTRYSRGRTSMPGQIPFRPFDDGDERPIPEGFTIEAFAASNPEIWERIKRAAEFYEEESSERFIWKTVWDAVRCAEDDMILSPRTGQLIGDALEIGDFELSPPQ